MKIICIGRNYVAHIEELNNEIPDEPVVFMKPDSALMRQRDAFYIPDWSKEIHYEAEIVIKFNRLGKNIRAKFAPKYYAQFSLGIDLTARDKQTELKKKGLPWEKAKAFDQSAVIGDWLDASKYELSNLEFSLHKNGEKVQSGNTSMMIHPVSELIAHCSSYFTIKIGDLLFTGTPKGVGKVESGDVLEGYIQDKKVLHLRVK
ncbi:MAG: fumarylacetoacetate hydrolase family protein [Bacteroidia bacterium]